MVRSRRENNLKSESRTEKLKIKKQTRRRTMHAMRIVLPCPDVGEAVTSRVLCREEKSTVP
jgi:hypothetical protein